jgi:hypothetical protein
MPEIGIYYCACWNKMVVRIAVHIYILWMDDPSSSTACLSPFLVSCSSSFHLVGGVRIIHCCSRYCC